MKVSMAIANRDEAEPNRKKEGDIIAVKPAGWQWGRAEVKNFLIVEVDLGPSITTFVQACCLQIPEFETGELDWPEIKDWDERELKITAKRRYKISFALLDGMGIDFAKVRDSDVEYQPIEKTTIQGVGLIADKVKKRQMLETDMQDLTKIDRATGKVKAELN